MPGAAPTVPTIETPRLVLAPHTLADFDDSAALWADPIVTRHIGGRPATREESWGRLHRYVGHWALLGFGYWAVRDRATRRFVGEVGVADFHRALAPDVAPLFENALEAGWALSPAAFGQGFATEALRAVLAFAEAFHAGRPLVCMISPENAASLRVADKCGFREVARTTYKDAPTILFDR